MKYLILFIVLLFSFQPAQSQNISDILEQSIASVVTVTVEQSDDGSMLLGFRGNADVAYQQQLDLSGSLGSGSGFIIERNGKKYVVTNSHVIESASEDSGSLFVYSINRTKYEVRVVGGDTFYDIAVLEFVNQPGSEISTIEFRRGDVRIGETVYAIGNPLGEYPYTVSEGIIGAKNRVRGGMTGKFGFLQSTATVIWGNSGGPLIDTRGRVVGINSQIALTQRGDQVFIQPQINFALEAELSNRLVNDIINNNGRVRRSFIGVEISDRHVQRNDWGGQANWVKDNEFPVLSAVIPESPAANTLRNFIGDELIKVGSVDVRNIEEVLGVFENTAPGSTIEFTFRKRNGSTETVRLRTEELNPARNTNIARHFFAQTGQVQLVDQQGIPKLRLGATDWDILAAGVSNNSVQNFWRIESVNDVATALRFMGMYGMVDIVITRPGDSPRVSRQDMSPREREVKTNVWY